MQTTNTMQQAGVAIRNGRLPEARRLLRQIIHEDSQNYIAWLLLARTTPSMQAALEYVKRAELLQPTSPLVKRARASLEQKMHAETRYSPHLNWWAATLVSGFTLLLVLLVAWFTPMAWDHVDALKASNIAKVSVISTAVPPDKTNSQVLVVETATLTPQPTPTVNPAATNPESSIYPEAALLVEGANDAGATTTTIIENNATNGGVEMASQVAMSGEAILGLANDSAGESIEPNVVDPAGLGPNGVGPDERWIDVNLNTQTLVAYEGDTPVFNSLISSGTWEYPTVTGQFHTWVKYESQDMNGYLIGYDYYLQNVPHVMYFYKDFAIHGAYWHNNFGVPTSHGCVNMNTVDAGWLYNWAPVGTMVNIHN